MEMIPDVSFVNNAEERVPLVLVLDCSGSMSGEPIRALQQGLEALDRDLKSDPKAAMAVRIKVIMMGGDDEVTALHWQDVIDFVPPALHANGRTPTGAAMLRALQEVEAEKENMRQNGIAYKRPLVYLMSDGVPTDDWASAAERCAAAQKAQKASIFAIAIGDDADTAILSRIADRQALLLKGLNFKELFLWLSASVKAVSESVQGAQVQLPSTHTWATVTA